MRPIALFLVILLFPTFALAEKVALVIGNARYTAVPELSNPENDSAAVAAALTEQGFQVTRADNLGRTGLYDALRGFREAADKADFAIVYYAGHGIEVAGDNYIVPVDARLEDERDASVEMVNIDVVLRQISGAARLKMVVLDACRNNPFVIRMKRESAGRNVGTGLGPTQATASDTLIAYAAAAGEITPDGEEGRNSPFTAAFVKALSGPPVDVRRLLGQVRDDMRRSVPGSAPFVYSSLGGGEYVINPRNVPVAPEPVALAAATPEPAPEPPGDINSIIADFARADRQNTLESWSSFLSRYQGLNYHLLYALALEKRDALQAARTAKVAAPAVAVVPVPAPVPPLADASPAPVVAVVPTPRSSSAPDLPQPAAAVAPSLVPVPMSRDNAIRALQTALQKRNCYGGKIDGILGRGSIGGFARLAELAGFSRRLTAQSETETLVSALSDLAAAPASLECPAIANAPRRTPSRTRTKPQDTYTVIIPAPRKPAQPKPPNSYTVIIPSPNSTKK